MCTNFLRLIWRNINRTSLLPKWPWSAPYLDQQASNSFDHCCIVLVFFANCNGVVWCCVDLGVKCCLVQLAWCWSRCRVLVIKVLWCCVLLSSVVVGQCCRSSGASVAGNSLESPLDLPLPHPPSPAHPFLMKKINKGLKKGLLQLHLEKNLALSNPTNKIMAHGVCWLIVRTNFGKW